jgi:hypothetical protein
MKTLGHGGEADEFPAFSREAGGRNRILIDSLFQYGSK